jgi:hypothetical protein
MGAASGGLGQWRRQTTGEVRFEEENRHHQWRWKAMFKAVGGKFRPIPSRTALKIAMGGPDGYCVARNRGPSGES